MKHLRRDIFNKIIGGVCAGIADYFKIDPVFIRILFIIFFFVYGFAVIPYLLLWFLMPTR